MTHKAPSWIAGADNPKASMRLFCFPFAGGGTLAYRDWSRHLPSQVELRPVKLPGREDRLNEACFQEALPLVRVLASGLASYLDRPFAFFGHSMGALLAFELARELRRQRQPEPFCLMASGRPAPQISISQVPLHKLSDAALIDVLRHYGGTPEIVFREKALMEVFLPMIRADLAINETYVFVPEKPLDYPIRAFGGESDVVPRTTLDAWRQQTTGSFALHMFPGGHFYLNEAEGPCLVNRVGKELEILLSHVS